MKFFIPLSLIVLALIDRGKFHPLFVFRSPFFQQIYRLYLALAIRCYVCNTTSSLNAPFQCSEWFDRYDKPDIEPQDCSNVIGAKYCIKHIGRFEGLSMKDFFLYATTLHGDKLILSLASSSSSFNI